MHFAQEPVTIESYSGKPDVHRIAVEKGQTLNDFKEYLFPEKDQTDINPGIDPEGDFMLRSTFTPDGSKILVCNGGSNTVSVFDYESMEVLVIIELGYYPCDVAVTDDYAIVPSIFGDVVDIIDLDDYSIVETFYFFAGVQPAVVEVSPDGQYAFVASDGADAVAVINLTDLTIENEIGNFPVQLITFSWVSTGGRSSFKFSRFEVSPDGNHLIVGNANDEVLYFNTSTGNIDYSIADIPNCKVVGLSGDGNKTIALSDYNNVFKVYQIDNSTHTITGTVELTGNYLATYEVAVNQDGSKAFVGIGNNSSAIVRFETLDYVTFTQTYTPFWMGTTADHNYAISGQYRFSIMDFENETMVDQLQGYSQDFGCISPTDYKAVGYDPLRYEGLYFYEFTDPSDIQFNGKELTGWPPEGDTPYRIAISPDGSKAITSNSLSENMSIIDLTSYSVDTIIDLDEKCDAVGITHDSQWGIMGGYDLNTIKIIDLVNNEFVTSVHTGQRPLMVAIAPDDSFAYIGNLKQNSVSFVELNGATSAEITEIPTGIIGLSWAAFGVRSSVEVDPTGQYVLVAASFADQVQVIDIDQEQIVANLNVGTFPLKIAFNATGDYAVVTNYSGDTYSILHVDGANSAVIGTFPAGDGPLRCAYNPINDEFGIVNYSTNSVINVDPETGNIISTDYYTQYGNPVMIKYDNGGNPIVLTLSTDDDPGHLIRNGEAIILPATPTYFDYCAATHTAVVCMPGPDYVSVIEFDQLGPVAEFTANTTNISLGESINFTDLSLNNPDGWAWEFEMGTPLTSNEQNPTVQYQASIGEFDVRLIVSNNYGSDTLIKEDYISVDYMPGYPELQDQSSKVSIFPNPASEQITIVNNNPEKDEILVSIFSLQGRFKIAQKLTNSTANINLTNFDPGLYLVKISTENINEYVKLVIE